jgi:hypothetical protein
MQAVARSSALVSGVHSCLASCLFFPSVRVDHTCSMCPSMPPPIKQVTKAPHLAVRSKHYSRSRWQNSRPANRIVGRRTMVLEAPALSSKRGTTPVQQTSPHKKSSGLFFVLFFVKNLFFILAFNFVRPATARWRRWLTEEVCPRRPPRELAMPMMHCLTLFVATTSWPWPCMHACMPGSPQTQTTNPPAIVPSGKFPQQVA